MEKALSGFLQQSGVQQPGTPMIESCLDFWKRINLSPNGLVQFAKENPPAAEKKIISLLSQDRLKIERGEITAGTVNNCLKAIRQQAL